jgi:hypothetical protein
MNQEESFLNILKKWKNDRFPHKKIKYIANEYSDENYVSFYIYEYAKVDTDIFLDFGGVFFWEYWKINKPNADIVQFLLLNVSSKKISPVTQFSIILALTSCYKNHSLYNKAIYNKLNTLIKNNNREMSEALISQIYEAIY